MTVLPDSDPITALVAWLDEARDSEPDVPDAVALATADAEGRPSVRMVLAKSVEPDGAVTFYTNLGSQKASELAANPVAALCFHWKSLFRQITVEGEVEPVSPEAADAYWATRPRGSQLGAYASRQSEPLASSAELEQRVAEFERQFAGADVPRPEFWSGYRLIPRRVVFWIGREDRLHDRCEFVRHGAGWTRALLNP